MSAFIKRNTPVAVGLAMAIVLGFLMRARAQDDDAVQNPPMSDMYIVNQTLCLAPQVDESSGQCKPVPIQAGSTIMLQLPGTPATWTVVSASPNLVADGGMTKLPSPNRIDGTSELFEWHFKAARPGNATLVMREFPPTISTSPAGTFTYTFQIQ